MGRMGDSLESRLKAEARRLGFSLAGIAPAADADGFDRFREWLARGYDGEMAYLRRHAEARQHPRAVLAAVRSVLVVGMEYAPASGTREGAALDEKQQHPHGCRSPVGRVAK